MKKPLSLIAYHVLSLCLFPFLCLFLAVALIRRPAYCRGVAQRFGFYPSGFFNALHRKQVFWIHAASVGEVMMARRFIRALKVSSPKAGIVFSTITPSGQEAARKELPEIDVHLYFPFDLLWIMRAVVQRMRPTLFLFLETEIWANCLQALSEQKIPAVMVNGRISERSFPRYQRLRPFLSAAFAPVSAFLMQSDADAARIMDLGAPADRVEATGNMKYDQAAAENPSPRKGRLTLETLGLNADTRLMIAGSTRPGEEGAVLKAYQMLEARLPSLRLLIAPRHLQRLDEVESLVSKRGFRVIRKTAVQHGREGFEGKSVLLLDTLGELAQIYSLGELIFVGGGLASFGGQNPLEAAAQEKPVFFGPHMDNFREAAEQLKACGGGIEVEDAQDLSDKMAALAQNPLEYRRRGAAARQVVRSHQGALRRNLHRLSQWLPGDGREPSAGHRT